MSSIYIPNDFEIYIDTIELQFTVALMHKKTNNEIANINTELT